MKTTKLSTIQATIQEKLLQLLIDLSYKTTE